MNRETQKERAEKFRQLHHGESMLVLPNIWDPLGAALLEDLGYPAIATASASIAYTHGVADGENIEFSELADLLAKITAAVRVPVTADIESGYAFNERDLRENIRRVVEAGVVGINIEDYDLNNRTMFPIAVHCKRLEIVRRTAEAAGIPLFVNARTDVYLKGTQWVGAEEKWEEACKRGKAYLDAGADGIYPIMLADKTEIARLVSALSCPVNVLARPGIPDFKTLKEIGVARISLGPGFLKTAIHAMKQLALQWKNGEAIPDSTGNEISNDYLKKLVSRSG